MKKSNQLQNPLLVFRSPTLFFAFGMGSGLSKIAPGTVGTVFAIPFYFLLLQFGWIGYAIITLVATVLGVWLCGKASDILNVHDHSGIVWDEFVGLWITLFLVPFSWQALVIGFVLFRFFDMLKPWPISLADKHVHGGFGIMLDDVIAGIVSCILLHLIVANVL